jgi:hypothetical protein
MDKNLKKKKFRENVMELKINKMLFVISHLRLAKIQISVYR